MKRELLLIVVAVLLVGAGWSAGRATAQARVADFELSIEAPRGEVRVACSRGCDWPSTGALATINFRCDSEQCRWMVDGHGAITMGFPR
jgi:hypothetical protein